MSKQAPTAAEFLAQLQKDPEFLERQRRREIDRAAAEEALRLEQASLLNELAQMGLRLESVWDLVNTRAKYASCIPILVKHLSLPYSRGVKEGIARALTVRYAGAEAFSSLLDEYQRQNDDSETSLKWVLGNALAETARSSNAEALLNLALDKRHGKARDQILLALPRVVRDKRRLQTALSVLLDDPDVSAFARRAMKALRKQ